MKLNLPVALTAAAVLAIAAAPSFACPCSEGAAKTSAETPKVSVQAVALKKPASTSTTEVPSISHKALLKAISQKKATVIDVNGTESYKEGRIPTAIDYAAVSGDLKAKLPANKKALIVAYCGSEKCGAYKKAATAAKELGYTNVVHYSPGIAGWKKSGAAVEKG